MPIIVGSLTGAFPTALALFLGNVIADLIGGWGLWFDWSVGNAVMGFFVGLLPVYGAYVMDGIFKVRHAILYAGELKTSIAQGVAASITNSVILVVLGIPILALLANRFGARMDLRETESDEE